MFLDDYTHRLTTWNLWNISRNNSPLPGYLADTHVPSYFPAEHWARSIKPLHEFYSTQAVMHHLWEANFQKPFGFSAPLLLQLLSQKQRNCAYVKRCCTYAPLDSWLHLCLGKKKCKCVLLSTITACLGQRFIENVLCSRTHQLWLCCCSSNKCRNTHQLAKRMDWLRSGLN